MDTLRGTFDSEEPAGARAFEEDSLDERDEDQREPPAQDVTPPEIGTDERRMQVRAYNHWTALLEDRNFPAIQDLDLDDLPDFGPYAVVLDFSQGADDPVVRFLGEELGAECGAQGVIERLSDVPPRSLLSRITDHYLQILGTQAPIGFEAEFVNLRGISILYRGILLPFSSNDETIDFICGVINWKEMADAQTADELLLEIDQAIDGAGADEAELEPVRHHADAMTDWADSPAHEEDPASEAGPDAQADGTADEDPAPAAHEDASRSFASLANGAGPAPDFDQYGLDDYDDDEEYDEDEGEYEGRDGAAYSFASLSDYIEAPAKKAIDLEAEAFDPEDYQVEHEASGNVERIDRFGRDAVRPASLDQGAQYSEHFAAEDDAPEDHAPEEYARDNDLSDDPWPEDPASEDHAPEDHAPEESAADELSEDADLADCLASARKLAQTASASEDRSRQALYAAVSRAYDFSLAASEAPEEYEALIAQSGLAVQERAPMTPVVKLVFGSDYDKTRLTEYAAVLTHAHRIALSRGALAGYLAEAEGGLKGVVKAERRLRREESGKAPVPERELRASLAKKLRELEALTFEAIEAEGAEFALVMVRRDGAGKVAVLGEIEEDVSLLERAAKRMVG